jgi:uncharacterized protein DUF11
MATAMSAGVATAVPPNWVMTVTPLPASVTPGAAAGFEVTVTNNGPSQISALYLNSNLPTVTPVYLRSVDRPGACGESGTVPPSGPLFCSFGALIDDQSVTIVVAYDTTGSSASFPITFQANTTGATQQDGIKGKSHGDTLTKTVSTALSTNKNFAGFFNLSGSGAIQNDANINGNNKQSTGVGNLPAGIEATVLDGPGATGTCVSGGGINCNALFGEWSEVNVNGGDPLPGGGYFTITIKFKTGTPTSFVHSYTAFDVDGVPYTAVEQVGQCPGNTTPVAAAIPCFTWNGVDTATIYTYHNGSWRGL